MELLFVEGEKGLVAARPVDCICFPDRTSKIKEPGLYDCHVLRGKDTFLFVDGNPIESYPGSGAEFTSQVISVSNSYPSESPSISDHHQEIYGKKIGKSYVYFDTRDYDVFYFDKNGNIHHLFNHIDLENSKRNYNFTMHDTFIANNDNHQKNDLSVNMLYDGIRESIYTIPDELQMDVCSAILAQVNTSSYSKITGGKFEIYENTFFSVSYKVEYEWGDPEWYDKYFVVIYYNGKFTLTEVEGDELPKFILSKIQDNSDEPPVMMNVSDVIDYMIDHMISIDSLARYQDIEKPKVRANCNKIFSFDYDQNNIREDLEFTVQFYKHTSVFDNIRMFHVIDAFAYLQIKLFAYKTDYEGIKKKVLTTLDSIISDRKQDLSSVSKIAGKNVTRQNMKELKKLSPKYILGFTK